MVYVWLCISLGAIHEEEANGHVPTGGQRNGVSCQ